MSFTHYKRKIKRGQNFVNLRRLTTQIYQRLLDYKKLDYLENVIIQLWVLIQNLVYSLELRHIPHLRIRLNFQPHPPGPAKKAFSYRTIESDSSIQIRLSRMSKCFSLVHADACRRFCCRINMDWFQQSPAEQINNKS